MRNFFRDWNYKKHAKVVTGIYLTCYAIDMTLGYLLMRKCLKDSDDAEK